jgi:hypothetical protein
MGVNLTTLVVSLNPESKQWRREILKEPQESMENVLKNL